MVIALDKNKRPAGFLTEKRCRKLFEQKRAVRYRMFPMVVILKDIDVRTFTQPLPEYRLKIDPGAKYDGFAIIDPVRDTVVFTLQVEHRAGQVKQNLDTRRQARRNRRSRETVYRKNKFAQGGTFTQPGNEGKLPPSIQSILANTETWVKRLSRWVNLTSVSLEAVRFDTQLLDDPNIEGKEYQQGTLQGTEIREYLLDRYQHTCQYCGGVSGDPVLEWEHIRPRSRGGSDSIKNATLACHRCNQDKGSMTPEEWAGQLKTQKTKLSRARLQGIEKVLAGKRNGGSSRYCAWVNITRKELERFLFACFGKVECASGGRTKYNRTRLGFPKDHQYDAACVGKVPEQGYTDLTHGYYTLAKAVGHGSHFRGKINSCGIIIQKLPPREKNVFGFMNGDIVAADIPKREKRPYKYEGHHVGRVMTRARGEFDIRTTDGRLIGANHRYVTKIQNADGYQYAQYRTPGVSG